MAPTRLRNSSAANATKEVLYAIPGLEFNEALTWKPGKPIAVADLLSRLEKLAAGLREFEQDQVDPKTFQQLAQDLTHPNLLGHKDKGIRAWTVCCIVDILKICAPDAPFNKSQLKDIFTVVINSILPALADPTNAYNQQHIYILFSLDEYKSIILVTDVDNAEKLIVPLFTICFDVVSGSTKSTAGVEVSKSVEYHLKRLLATVIEETTLPQEVTDIIISQFLRVDPRSPVATGMKHKKAGTEADGKQGTLLLKDYPPAYNMAKSICAASFEKMTAQITQYFGTVIVDATSNKHGDGHHRRQMRHPSELDDSEEEDEGELTDLRKAHHLLRELWRACPDVLTNVIPHVEAELDADNIVIRQIATETLGYIAAGIGIAGMPQFISLDPAAYPPLSVDDAESAPTSQNPLLVPASPKPFATVYASAYQKFLSRRQDKAVDVRCAWTVSVSHILATAAGGIGLSEAEREDLLVGYSQILRDTEEKVRLTGIRSLSIFNYHSVINILAADGGISKSESVLATLCDRVKDKKPSVREEAIKLLSRMWGAAAFDIEKGNGLVVSALGDIPNRLLDAYFVNDLQVHALLDQSLYEALIPISFPAVKEQPSRNDSQRQKAKDSQSSDSSTVDPDAIRARRILTLIRSLDTKSRQVFFGMQRRRTQMQHAVSEYLKTCEDFNGGVVEDDKDENTIKNRLVRYIEAFSKHFPDATKVNADLLKFAKAHDRRNYQLMKFAMGPEHDYRTMSKAIKELSKRIREGPANVQSLIDTLMPLIYRCALVVYNRSHVPAIMEVARTDEEGLAETAHEVLKDISINNPAVLKTQIQALCKELEQDAPSATKSEELAAGDTLKACAGFARKYPSEITKERKFITAMINYALYSKTIRAAKHAVSIIFSVADKKELFAKEILTKTIKDCTNTSPYFLARLAAISQICLLAPAAANAESDAILRIVVAQTLRVNRSPDSTADPNAWPALPDDETLAKELALKIMVNQCRSEDPVGNPEEFQKLASTVIQMLLQLVTNDGEIAPSKDTPPAQRNYLRLTAARFVLKLCSHQRRCEELVTPSMFISIALVVINPPNAVRTAFVNQLKKYLAQNRLHHRWFTILFLLAFEPDAELRSATTTWLKSRVHYFSRLQQAKNADKKAVSNVMENIFARLISLLVHHPDYPEKGTEDFDSDLSDFAKYFIFYLTAVATEDNISLIFHIAQRVKQTQDAVSGDQEASERLYVLSDLAQAVIRNYADLMPAHAKGINLLQTWPGKISLPTSLYKALPSHEIAQEIVEKNFLPEDVALGLERLIRSYQKSLKSGKNSSQRPVATDKKRKSGDSVDASDDEQTEHKKPAKRAKKSSKLPIRRTPKPNRKSSEPSTTEQPSRKSARVSSAKKNYDEGDSEDDDAVMEEEDQVSSSPVSHRQSRGKATAINDADEEVNDRPEDESHQEAEPEPEEEAEEEAESTHNDVVMTDTNGHLDDEKENDEVDNAIDVEGHEGQPEGEPSPSPLKNNANPRATRAKGKSDESSKPTKKPSASEKKAKKDDKPAEPVTRRQTRRTKV